MPNDSLPPCSALHENDRSSCRGNGQMNRRRRLGAQSCVDRDRPRLGSWSCPRGHNRKSSSRKTTVFSGSRRVITKEAKCYGTPQR